MMRTNRLWQVASPLIAVLLAGGYGRAAGPDSVARKASGRTATLREECDSSLASAICQLGSETFSQRQAAMQQLLKAGGTAVDALEHSAKSEQLETAKRCVEVLARIARGSESSGAATSALERLAKDQSARVADQATITIRNLNTTDEDRAIGLLEAAGVRLSRGRNGEVFSATLDRDGQLIFAKYLSQLRSVLLRGEQVTNAGLAVLSEIRGLSRMTIIGTSITDSGLGELHDVAGLTHLALSGDGFSAGGLRELQHVASLRSLQLLRRINESELWFLAELTQVNTLYMSDVHLGELGVATINKLKHIKRLMVSGNGMDDEQLRWFSQLELPLNLSVMMSPQVTDAGIKHLEGSSVVGLTLAHTPITDGGLVHVGKMTQLQSLVIMDVPISDAGLEHLRELRSLRTLLLRNTNTTEAGLTGLYDALPNLRRS